jgi:preprotein translocase subunit YajC
MQTIMVICGFLGPLIVIGIIGIFYLLHEEKKERQKDQKAASA